MNRMCSGMENNDAESPVCWEMQQQEVITIAFFPTKRLALGSVDEDCFGEIAHHRMQLPKEMLCLKSRAEGVRMLLVWQTPTLPVHFTCILATVHQQIPKKPLCFEEPERVHRHVAHKGSCIRSPREIPSIVGI